MSPTATVTFLLVAAIQAIGVGITAPSDGDAVAIFALILVAVALDIAAVLEAKEENLEVIDVPESSKRQKEPVGPSVSWSVTGTSSEPSAQSWSPSHFQRPAMQRPLVQANSLSEHWRGTEGRGRLKLSNLVFI